MASKTTRPLVTIVDLATGETITREMNDEEMAQLKIDQDTALAEAAELARLAEAKAALLEKLGITEDDAKLLLS